MASSIVDDKRRLFQELHIKRAIHDYRGVVAFLCCCAIPGGIRGTLLFSVNGGPFPPSK